MTLEELRIVLNLFLQNKDAKINLVPEQMDLVLRVASLRHFKRKLGLPEEYAPTQPFATQVPEISTKITMDLDIFKVWMGGTNGKLTIDADGIAILPTDHFYPLSIIYPVTEGSQVVHKNVEVLTDSEWADTLSSKIIIPSRSYPVANFQSGIIRFMPKNLQFVDFTYLRKPKNPVYATTIVSGSNVYDPVHSQELEWDEVNQIDIIHLILSDMGVVCSLPDIFNVAEKVKKQGI